VKTHRKNGFEYFYDTNCKHWVLYPIDKNGNRIEWDKQDNPIESQYFINKKQLTTFLNTHNYVSN